MAQEHVQHSIRRRSGRHSERATSRRPEVVQVVNDAGCQAIQAVLEMLDSNGADTRVTAAELVFRGLAGDAQALRLALLMLVMECGIDQDEDSFARIHVLISAVQAVNAAADEVEKATDSDTEDTFARSVLATTGRTPTPVPGGVPEPEPVIAMRVSIIELTSPANAPNGWN